MLEKPFWKSSTFWINAAGIIATILTVVAGMTQDTQIVTILLAVANILNRFRTPQIPTKLTLT